MKKPLTTFGVILVASLIFSACNTNKTGKQNTAGAAVSEDVKMKTEQELRTANDQLYAALNAMFTGNLEPMNAIWSQFPEYFYI